MRQARRVLASVAAAWIVLGSLAAWAGLTEVMPSFRRWSPQGPLPGEAAPVVDTGP